MIMAQSTPGWTMRLNTSSPSVNEFDFFLVILATSSPSPLRILQLLLLKQPSTQKLGPEWPDAVLHDDPDMDTSASWPFCRTEHFLIENSLCDLVVLPWPSSDAL
jgi:hypothetical protein